MKLRIGGEPRRARFTVGFFGGPALVLDDGEVHELSLWQRVLLFVFDYSPTEMQSVVMRKRLGGAKKLRARDMDALMPRFPWK